MIASLMMYARPEIAAENARYWALIRAALAARGIAAPETLSDGAPEFDVWLSPDLVFSQTCGMPYRTKLADHVTLIGTADYGLENCAPGHYNSAVVVRADDPRDAFADFASARFVYNQECSQSGYGAAYLLAKTHGFWFSDQRASGGHILSARTVAQNNADIAFIDAQTWRLIQRYDDFSRGLRVLMWTEQSPGLPYISGKGTDAGAMFDAVTEAIVQLSAADRDVLGLHGLVRIPKAAYLAVETPPLLIG